MVYMENEGALFRGFAFRHPQELWNELECRWEPYTGERLKPIEWGMEITEERALEWMARDKEKAGVQSGA